MSATVCALLVLLGSLCVVSSIAFAENVQQQDYRGSRERAGSFAPALPSIDCFKASPSVDRSTFENVTRVCFDTRGDSRAAGADWFVSSGLGVHF